MSVNLLSTCSDLKPISEPSSPVSCESTLSRANTASIVASKVVQASKVVEEDRSEAYKDFSKDTLLRLVKARDKDISRLESHLDEVKNDLKAKGKLATKYHTDWLDLYKKNHALIILSSQLTEKNATMEQQLSFIKKSALISLIGLGTVALVATQFKKPQHFGANTLQIIKSLLFDRLIGFNGGAFSLAKGAASDVISSAKEAIEGYMSNPSTGSDFTF